MINNPNSSEQEQLIQTISQAERDSLQVTINKQNEGCLWTKQKGYAYLHVEGEKGFRVRRLSDLPFSRIIIAVFAKTLMRDNQIDRQEWMVLPCYLSKGYSQGDKVVQITDVQTVVTGNIKTQIKQSPLDATLRQIREQIGLQFQQQTFYGIGIDGNLDFVKGQYRKKVYPSLVRVKKIIKKHVNFQHLFNDDKQQEDTMQKIQNWIVVKTPHSPYIFQRRRDSKSTIGYIVALIKIKDLLPVIAQLKESRQQRFKINYENEQDSQIDEVRQCFKRMGSLKWQNNVKEMDQNELDEFIEKIKKDIWKLAINKYGNHLINEICKVGAFKHRKQLLEIIAADLKKIATKFFGTRLLQQLIQHFARNKQDELLLFLLSTIQNNKSFDEIAMDQRGSYFLRTLIRYLPIQEVVGINHFYEDTNIEQFSKIISNQYSVFVMRSILIKLEIGCKQGIESASKRKKQFIKQLTNCFQQCFYSSFVYAIQIAYMILDPNELEPLTLKILKKQENILLEGDQQYMKKIKKFYDLLVSCHDKYWKHPYYDKHYESLSAQLTITNIKSIIGSHFCNKLVRSLLQVHNNSIKMKLANVIFDISFSDKIEEPQKLKEMQELQNKFEINYEKTQDGWVLRKDRNIETNFNVLKQKHEQTRQQYLKNFSFMKDRQKQFK